MAKKQAPKAQSKKTEAAPVQAAPAQAAPSHRIPAGKGNARSVKQNPGQLFINMGPMTVVPGSVKELKGRYGAGISAEVSVPTRTQPIRVSTYDPKQIDVLRGGEKHQKPIHQLLAIKRTSNQDPATGVFKSALYYNMSGMDSRRPVPGMSAVYQDEKGRALPLGYGTKEIPSPEGNGTIEVGMTTAFIEGSIGKDSINLSKKGEHVTGVIMAAGHPVRFTVPLEIAEQCEIGDVLREKTDNGKGSYVRAVAEVYVEYDQTYGAQLAIPMDGVLAFWRPFADKVTNDDDDSQNYTQEQAPSGDVPGM